MLGGSRGGGLGVGTFPFFWNMNLKKNVNAYLKVIFPIYNLNAIIIFKNALKISYLKADWNYFVWEMYKYKHSFYLCLNAVHPDVKIDSDDINVC